jgi:hypothetical protein
MCFSGYILVLVLATSSSAYSGATTVQAEFETEQRCMAAGTAINENAHKRGSHVLTWGCFKR